MTQEEINAINAEIAKLYGFTDLGDGTFDTKGKVTNSKTGSIYNIQQIDFRIPFWSGGLGFYLLKMGILSVHNKTDGVCSVVFKDKNSDAILLNGSTSGSIFDAIWKGMYEFALYFNSLGEREQETYRNKAKSFRL